MTKLLQTVLDGVAVGSLYALIALGYTMVYGILKFINFAHSDVFMFGAWISFAVASALSGSTSGPPLLALTAAIVALAAVALTLNELYAQAGALVGLASLLGGLAWGTRHLGLSPPLLVQALLVQLSAMALAGLIGFTVERFAYRPLRSAPRINVLITAIGISLLLENVGQLPYVFGTQPQPMPVLLPDMVLFTVLGVNIGLVKVLCVGIALVLMFLLERLVFGTKIGRAMRAVSFDHKTASLMGIDVDQVVSTTFVIGSMLAAAAGFLNTQLYPTVKQPADSQWTILGLKCFVAAVVGGIGNIRGAMAGGILIGLIEMLGSAYFSPNLQSVYVFSILIAVLLFKPEGLLGKATVEKV